MTNESDRKTLDVTDKRAAQLNKLRELNARNRAKEEELYAEIARKKQERPDLLTSLERHRTEMMQFCQERAERKATEATWRKDWRGVPVSPHMYSCYQDCLGCGMYVWRSNSIIGLCPNCVIALPAFELEISFGHSKSKKYRTALKRARAVPTYEKEGERHVVRFGSLGEYSGSRHAVDKLMTAIYGWNSARAILNGEEVTSQGLHFLSWEIDRIRDLAGAADVTFFDGAPIFTPKVQDPPGTVFGIDPTHPNNLIEITATTILGSHTESDSYKE